jgi:hypothetical protein
MTHPLENHYPPRTIEWYAGQIPEYLGWFDLGANSIESIESLMEDGWHFRASEVSKRNWHGIIARTDGQLDDDDMGLLCSKLHEHACSPVYVTSLAALKQPKSNSFLGVCLPSISSDDLGALRAGFWCAGDWIDRLETKDLMWKSWQEQIYFNWPMTFAMTQLCEGEGETTIVGSNDFIQDFLISSKPETYVWRPLV